MSCRVPPPARRWAISFADLALLIACTLMLGWRPAATVDGAVASAELAAVPVASLFVPGEAMLSARAAELLAPVQRAVAEGARISVTVGIDATGSARLDAWELAAARTAVIARALGSERVVLAAPEAGTRVHIVAVR